MTRLHQHPSLDFLPMFPLQIFLSFVLFCQIGLAEQPTYITFPSDIAWKSQTSQHFTAVFRAGKEDLALKVLSAAEKAHTVLTPIFPEGPEHTYIVVADFKDSLNGYALNFPYSHIVFFASPPNAGGQLAHLDDWIYSVILHEYVHILHIYPASGLWKVLRAVFGTWVVPNGMMPSHLHEGLATFLETEKTHGGRGRSSIFAMYRRMAVESGQWGTTFAPLDLLDGSSSRWPYGTSAYFFGYELYQELWSQKGKQGIYDLTDAYSSNLPYFINRPLEKVFNTDYPTLWHTIYEKEKQKTLSEIDQLKASPLSTLNYLTQNQSYKGGLKLSPDKNRVAFVAETAKEPSAVYTLDLKSLKKEKIVEINDSSFYNLCWVGEGPNEKLFYISADKQNNYAINHLYVWDFKNQMALPITTNEGELTHVHRVDCSARGDKFLVYTDENERGFVWELLPTETISLFKVAKKWKIPERQWVTSLLAGDSAWIGIKEQLATHIYRWSDSQEPKKITTLPHEVFNLRLGDQPNHLEAISDLSGKYEIYDIDFEHQNLSAKTSVLGGITSFEKKDSQYLITSYRHRGFDIASTSPLEIAPFSFPKIEAATPLPDSLTQVSSVQDYSPWGTLRPRTWVPSLLFVPDGAQVGAWIPGFDLTQRHLYDLFAGYDSRGLPFGSLSYTFRFGKNSSLLSGLNFSPSYLRVSKSFFKRWGGSVGYGQTLPWGLPRSSLSLVFNRLEASAYGPAEQSVGLELSLSKAWGFSQRKQAISPVNGVKASLTHANYFKFLGSNNDFFTSVASLSSYLEVPWAADHVVYLGNKLGYTEGSSFINSFFQGGGELLFSQGRGLFLNRGFFPSLFAGRRMFATNLEYRFPIKRIERGYALLPTYLSSLSGALVADTLSYDRGPSHPTFPKDLFKKFYTSVGAEIKSNWKLLYYLPTEVRLGLYHGFGPYGENLYFTLGVEAGL